MASVSEFIFAQSFDENVSWSSKRGIHCILLYHRIIDMKTSIRRFLAENRARGQNQSTTRPQVLDEIQFARLTISLAS